MIITIDGPASSGKSTTARAVAERMGYLYLDTGAMYRAVALAFLREDASPTPDAAQEVLPRIKVDISHEDGTMHVHLNGTDVTAGVRTQRVGEMASRVSTLRGVRDKMVREQRRIAQERQASEGGLVADGRDMGTVVFPQAEVKIYMEADARVRARRRHEEYQRQGEDIAFEEVLREIQARDRQDRTRDIAPLRRADDAIELDTTDCSVEEQVEFVVEHIRSQAEQGT